MAGKHAEKDTELHEGALESRSHDSEIEIENEQRENQQTDDNESHPQIEQEGQESRRPWYKRCWHWLLTHKKVSIPVVVVILLGVLAAVPFTRYLIAGTVVRQSFPVVVIDAETGKPVSSATVRLTGKEATTDNEGRTEIRTNVGHARLEVTKKYYESTIVSVLIPLKKPSSPYEVRLKATGRAVPVTVLNKISKKPAANVTIKAVDEDTEAKTDDEGKATLVVPADKQEIKVSLNGEGFNGVEAALKVTVDDNPANTFEVTPSGKIYFLSNASGKIDLVKSNLDGTDRQIVLAGTGKEDRSNTVLLASRDWKYIALLSKRDGGEYSKLFLIETQNGDKLTTMDEGEATFTLYGWSDDKFIYVVDRDKRKSWESGRQALKSYNASTKKIITLTETAAEGDQNNYAYEYFGDRYIYILGEKIVFVKNWGGGCAYYYNCNGPAKTQGKQATLDSVRSDGSQKKVIKSYNDQYVEARIAGFGEIYILFEEDGKDKVDEYHDGKIETINQDKDDFYNEAYPIYAVSPTGNKTLWSERRDGKNAFFVGDGNGENGKEVGRSDEFTLYGWFTDDYILLTKKGSEMHIMPADGLDGGIEKALKISDYYKPNYYNNGFGYGYGG